MDSMEESQNAAKLEHMAQVVAQWPETDAETLVMLETAFIAGCSAGMDSARKYLKAASFDEAKGWEGQL